MDYKKRCADCASLVENKGEWCCDECFGQKCADVDDCPYSITEEDIAELDKKIKVDVGIKGTIKEKSDKKPKTVKVSAEKTALFDLIWEGLSNYYENCTISTPNKAIDLTINGKEFTINLVEHRVKK